MTYTRREYHIFRLSCLAIGLTYMLLAASILGRGPSAAMEPFGVPQPVLASPHYVDAIQWVYVHTFVLGLVIAIIGWFSETVAMHRAFSVTMSLAHIVYLWMDLRTSETFFGNGLYQGRESAIPAMIVFVILITFIILSCRSFRSAPV